MAGKKERMTIKLKKEDSVRVITGRERGKTGRILRIDRAKGRVFLHGLNMAKKAVKKRKQTDQGGIIDIEGSIDLSDVMIICAKCGPTRIGYKDEDGTKARICKKCGGAL